MKKNVMLMIKGFFFGIANIIPGVSGGTLALTMGIYEDLLEAISNIFTKMKKSLMFLLPLGIGAVIAILLGSKVIDYSLENYNVATILFFIGLIIGGLPILGKKVIGKKVKVTNVLLFLLTFSIVIAMTFMNDGVGAVSFTNMGIIEYIKLFFVGIVAAGTMVIPGVSGSFVLMLIGYYDSIVNVISNVLDLSKISTTIAVLVPFGLGALFGIIGFAKLLGYLFKKYELPVYYAVLGFIVSSVIGLIMSIIGVSASIVEIIIGTILFIGGSLIGYKLGDE